MILNCSHIYTLNKFKRLFRTCPVCNIQLSKSSFIRYKNDKLMGSADHYTCFYAYYALNKIQLNLFINDNCSLIVSKDGLKLISFDTKYSSKTMKEYLLDKDGIIDLDKVPEILEKCKRLLLLL